MPGFLDNYGVSDARRSRNVWRIIGGAVAIVAVALGTYSYLHDAQEKRQVSRFFDLLRAKDFDNAYRLWGCDPAKPCRDYNMEKFLDDWGPKGQHADLSTMRVRRTRSCDGGVIQIVEFKPGDEALLYVSRADKSLAYSPFEYCVDAAGRNTKFWDIFFR